MADKKEKIAIRTPKFRVSFPELFEAKAFEDKAPKFSIQMLFDKTTDLSELKDAVKAVAKEKWGNNIPKGLSLPFRDGNEKTLDSHKNKIVVSAFSKYKPIVVKAKFQNGQAVPILDPEEIYAGCYAIASISPYAWEHKNKQGAVMKRGVSFNLNAVQKAGEGERFSKLPDASEMFESFDDGSDDVDNFETDNSSDDFDFDL